MMRSFGWLAVPVVLLVALVAALVWFRPLQLLTAASPPVEEVSFSRVRLDPGVISLTVTADGSQPVRIAQVQVDGAYRVFTIDPPGPIERLGSARIDIPYHWVAGEAHHIALLTSTGAMFSHTIEVAALSPRLSGDSLALMVLVGLLLGVAPIAIGMLAFPALKNVGSAGMSFLLALTAGLLLYLFIDTLMEGFEEGSEALGRLRGQIAVIVVALLSALALFAAGRRGGKAPEGVRLAAFIALGIGIHNFGEGLAVGAALATGAAALATFLVIGFAIHNVSEGFGVAVPLVGRSPSVVTFIWLALLAGLPAVPGVWLGSQAVSPFWIAICFGIGAGAILQVIVEVLALLARRSGPAALTSGASLAGAAVGLIVMYGTAILV
jgi:zinc transporter ZupT